MQCPACSATLQMTERQGVEIDYCPQCRGVWLDRGELDKIIERSHTMERSDPGERRSDPSERRTVHAYRDDDDDYRHKRKRNWLEDLFD